MMVIRQLLCSQESVKIFLSQFKSVDSLIQLILASSICDLTICTHAMFSKFQLEYKGGKAKKKSNDKGLDDTKVKIFFKKFKANPDNAHQIKILEQLKKDTNCITDEDFVLELIAVGEKFMIVDDGIPIDFQVEFTLEEKQQIASNISKIKSQFSVLQQNRAKNNYLIQDYDSSIMDSSDSEDDSEQQ